MPNIMSPRVCMVCNFIGEPQKAGSGLIEFILWMFCLVPGMVYSVWRSNNSNACPQCKGTMIPVHTPKAQEIIQASPAQTTALQDETAKFQKKYKARQTEKKFIDRFIYIGLALVGLMLMIMFIYAGGQ